MSADASRVSPEMAAEIYRRAAELNRADPLRDHGLLRFPEYGQVVMTGDLHGNHANFAKLCRYAMLDRAAARHVILHELIHADTPPGVPDDSHTLLLEAARYKCEHPDQVHFLQSNHELSQLTGHQILKNGRAVIEDFRLGIATTFGADAEPIVYGAIVEFLASFPLAGWTPNRVWLSHSLPAADEMRSFDPSVFSREVHSADRDPGGPVYQLVWGRRFTPEHLAALGRMFDADFFLIGHIPQESGFEVRLDRVIILASDHNHGSFLPFDLSRRYSIEELAAQVRKFVAVA